MPLDHASAPIYEDVAVTPGPIRLRPIRSDDTARLIVPGEHECHNPSDFVQRTTDHGMIRILFRRLAALRHERSHGE